VSTALSIPAYPNPTTRPLRTTLITDHSETFDTRGAGIQCGWDGDGVVADEGELERVRGLELSVYLRTGESLQLCSIYRCVG
jgi:hypothetical protein